MFATHSGKKLQHTMRKQTKNSVFTSFVNQHSVESNSSQQYQFHFLRKRDYGKSLLCGQRSLVWSANCNLVQLQSSTFDLRDELRAVVQFDAIFVWYRCLFIFTGKMSQSSNLWKMHLLKYCNEWTIRFCGMIAFTNSQQMDRVFINAANVFMTDVYRQVCRCCLHVPN